MTASDIDKYFASIGFEPTPGQRRFIEAMERAGKQMGEQLAAGIKDEINATIRRYRK